MYMKEEYNVPVNYANPDSGNTALHLAMPTAADCVKILISRCKGCTEQDRQLRTSLGRAEPALACGEATSRTGVCRHT